MKLVIIKTHGFSVHEGTHISLINEMNLASNQPSTHSAYLYDERGICTEAWVNRFQTAIHTMVEGRS